MAPSRPNLHRSVLQPQSSNTVSSRHLFFDMARCHKPKKVRVIFDASAGDFTFSFKQGAITAHSTPHTGDDYAISAVSPALTLDDGDLPINEMGVQAEQASPASHSTPSAPAASPPQEHITAQSPNEQVERAEVASNATTPTMPAASLPKADFNHIHQWRHDLQRAFVPKDLEVGPVQLKKAHEALLQIEQHDCDPCDVKTSKLGKVLRRVLRDATITADQDSDFHFKARLRATYERLAPGVEANEMGLEGIGQSLGEADDHERRIEVLSAPPQDMDDEAADSAVSCHEIITLASLHGDDIPSDSEDDDFRPSDSSNDDQDDDESDSDSQNDDLSDSMVCEHGSTDRKKDDGSKMTGDTEDWGHVNPPSLVEDNRHDTKYAPASRPDTYLTGLKDNNRRILVPVGVRRTTISDFPRCGQALEKGMVGGEAMGSCARAYGKNLVTTYGVGYEPNGVAKRGPGLSKCDWCYFSDLECSRFPSEKAKIRWELEQQVRAIYACPDDPAAVLDAARAMATLLDRLDQLS